MTSTRTIILRLAIASVMLVTGLSAVVWRHASPTMPIAGVESVARLVNDFSDFNPQEKFSSTPALASQDPVTLIAAGDVMTSRAVATKMKEKGADYPFAHVAEFLKNGDIVFGNLETSITPGRAIKPLEMMFRADLESAPALAKAGFTILSLANNHSPNFGAHGLLDTFRFLIENGITYVGAGRDADEAFSPVFLTANGMTFAFLAYNDDNVVPASYEATAKRPGTAFMRVEKMTEAVKLAKTAADVVIVSMHSGTEYARLPNASQQSFARAAIDAGAEMVIGHHPHVVQTLEKYNGKYIFYSLGNFIFDQMQSRDMREGLAVRITFDQTNVSRISLHPVLIEDYAQPRLLEGGEAEAVVKKLGYPVGEDGVFL